MSSTDYIHDVGDDYITEQITTSVQTAQIYGHLPYRVLGVFFEDGRIGNNGTDAERVTVKVVDGLEVARGTSPLEATVMNYDGDVTLSVDGQQITKTLTNGSVEFDLTTDKSAGAEIEIVAESLADHPTDSDSAVIEVVSA